MGFALQVASYAHRVLFLILAAGRGSWLACDLPGTGSNPVNAVLQVYQTVRFYCCFAADRRQASSHALQAEAGERDLEGCVSFMFDL
jgi:hypothetical protein